MSCVPLTTLSDDSIAVVRPRDGKAWHTIDQLHVPTPPDDPGREGPHIEQRGRYDSSRETRETQVRVAAVADARTEWLRQINGEVQILQDQFAILHHLREESRKKSAHQADLERQQTLEEQQTFWRRLQEDQEDRYRFQNERLEAERRQRAAEDQHRRQEAQRRWHEEQESKQREEEATREARRLAREEEEGRRRQEAERLRREDEDLREARRLAREEEERWHRQEADRRQREEQALRHTQRLAREEENRWRRQETERRQREEEDLREAQRLAREEEERWQREENERRQREEEALREAQRLAREEALREAQRLAREEEERWRREEEELARLQQEAMRMQQEEAERVRRERLRECTVCREMEDRDIMVALPCNHWYCTEDIEAAFRVAIEGNPREPFRCCGRAVPINLHPNPTQEFRRRYLAMELERNTPNPIYCSNRRCGQSIAPAQYRGPDQAVCNACGNVTCRHCRNRGHTGVVCPRDEGAQRLEALAAQQGWRRCQKCSTIVEKIYGCNHMTCRCGSDWCYVCGSMAWQNCMH